MNLRHLYYLRLAVELGGMTAAAQRAGVTQPAISQAIRALESAFGTTLFEKVGTSVIATPMAKQLAALSRRWEADIERVTVRGAARRMESADIAIGLSPGAAIRYAALLSTVWSATNPKARLRFVSGNAMQLLDALHEGALAFAICPRPRRATDSRIVERVLFRSSPAIYARARHPLLGARTLEDLRNISWVVVGKGSTPGDMVAEAFGVRRLGQPHIHVECADYLAMIGVIAESDMMGIVPSRSIIDSLNASSIREVHVVEGLPTYDVCLYARPDRHSPFFERVLKELAAGDTPD